MPRWSNKATPYPAALGMLGRFRALLLFSKMQTWQHAMPRWSMKASPILAALGMLGRFRVLLLFSKKNEVCYQRPECWMMFASRSTNAPRGCWMAPTPQAEACTWSIIIVLLSQAIACPSGQHNLRRLAKSTPIHHFSYR